MRTKSLGLAFLVVLGAVSAGCSGDSEADSGLPQVVGAFYPFVYASERVGGDLVEVENATPPGVEPHDLELTADQVATLSEADLVVYLGGGFQPALEDVVSGLDESAGLDALEGRTVNEGAEGETDPHIWLDPTIMASVADEIAARLSDIDSANGDVYAKNADDLATELQQLDEEFNAELSDCERADIVTSHDAFGYLASRYDLEQVSIAGIDPEAEPSPERLAEVATFVEENDVTTIFFEELVSPDVAETIASETGAETAMLSPLESAPEDGDYFDAMRANLAALREALGCD